MSRLNTQQRKRQPLPAVLAAVTENKCQLCCSHHLGCGIQHAARGGWLFSERWAGEGGEGTAVFWKSMTAAVAESFHKQGIQSLIKAWYFYCSWREGVRVSFGDLWGAICFLECWGTPLQKWADDIGTAVLWFVTCNSTCSNVLNIST